MKHIDFRPYMGKNILNSMPTKKSDNSVLKGYAGASPKPYLVLSLSLYIYIYIFLFYLYTPHRRKSQYGSGMICRRIPCTLP